MEEVDSSEAEVLLVVAILLPQVDHRADAVLARELGGAFDRKAGADRQIVGQPVEIRRPASFRVRHGIFFIFFLSRIFFFIFPLARYCCFWINTVVSSVIGGNNKALQLFRARMVSHSNPEPTRT
jgi:hypothetical protein